MSTEGSLPSEIQLNWSVSMMREAKIAAEREGISLEDFIVLALTEKLVRSEHAGSVKTIGVRPKLE
jgi:hypothetical protein